MQSSKRIVAVREAARGFVGEIFGIVAGRDGAAATRDRDATNSGPRALAPADGAAAPEGFVCEAVGCCGRPAVTLRSMRIVSRGPSVNSS